ncbi:MAG: serine hydrolase, partial [Patescibacteria group bacterium]
TGKILFDKNADKEAPIASITKLMTALVFLDHNPGWETIYEMKAEDKREGGKINLFTGEKVMVRDLFYSSLVASDNVATIGLINSTGMSLDDFIAKMNEKAMEIGLDNTKFRDPLGLNDNNVSNALEIARLANKTLLKDEIREATMTKIYEFKTQQGRAKIVYSTDDLLSVFPEDGIEIKGGKTGYTEAAGYCFVGKFGNDGDEIISVVLNGDSKNSRFDQTHTLVKWIYDSYVWD